MERRRRVQQQYLHEQIKYRKGENVTGTLSPVNRTRPRKENGLDKDKCCEEELADREQLR